jgi:hypothetical protein
MSHSGLLLQKDCAIGFFQLHLHALQLLRAVFAGPRGLRPYPIPILYTYNSKFYKHTRKFEF